MSIIKKKVSKKNKASWRKYVNIKDVEDFLEEKRLEERLGSVAEKKDDELFTIETKSSKDVITSKSQRKLRALRPLKNLTALENTSKVPDPIAKRNKVKFKKNGRNLIEEVLNASPSPRALLSIKDRKKYYEKFDKALLKTKEHVHDLWDEKEDPQKEQFLNNEFLPRNLALHNLKNLGKPVIKIADCTHLKTSRIKAFQPPHPGISYNPTLKDHQDLLQQAIDKEELIIKERNHLKRVTTNMFQKVTADERDMNWRTEMADESDVINEEHKEASADVNSTPNPPVVNKKKSKQARRKQKEQKMLKQKLLKKKEMKKQITDLHKLNKLAEEVLDEQGKIIIKKKRKEEVKEKKKYEPRRIGKIKFEEPDIDVNMIEDIAGNLRNVKPESSLLVDRFKNLQKRNILPPSVDLGSQKRRKIKRFVRSSHKEPGK